MCPSFPTSTLNLGLPDGLLRYENWWSTLTENQFFLVTEDFTSGPSLVRTNLCVVYPAHVTVWVPNRQKRKTKGNQGGRTEEKELILRCGSWHSYWKDFESRHSCGGTYPPLLSSGPKRRLLRSVQFMEEPRNSRSNHFTPCSYIKCPDVPLSYSITYDFTLKCLRTVYMWFKNELDSQEDRLVYVRYFYNFCLFWGVCSLYDTEGQQRIYFLFEKCYRKKNCLSNV